MRPLFIVGAGGFGREVVQLVAAINAMAPQWDLLGVLDDAPSEAATLHLERLGVAVLGGVAQLGIAGTHITAVIAIGDPGAKAAIAAKNPDSHWATLVHPHATLGADVTLGDGSIIAAGARISTNVRVGEHVHVDQNVTIGHDCCIRAFARLNPQACLSGAATLGEGALIGANATILQGLNIGAGAIVGAGAVVTRDVAKATTVRGVPAK